MEMLNVDTYPTQIEIHTLCKRNLLNTLYTEYTGCNSITCQPEKFNGSGATKKYQYTHGFESIWNNFHNFPVRVYFYLVRINYTKFGIGMYLCYLNFFSSFFFNNLNLPLPAGIN